LNFLFELSLFDEGLSTDFFMLPKGRAKSLYEKVLVVIQVRLWQPVPLAALFHCKRLKFTRSVDLLDLTAVIENRTHAETALLQHLREVLLTW